VPVFARQEADLSVGRMGRRDKKYFVEGKLVTGAFSNK
jgi:hypothetical protein